MFFTISRIGVKNLETFNLFAPLLDHDKDYVVVSPDIGGVIRAQKFSALLNCDLAIINKTRPNLQECSMNDIIGNVEGKNCILIDDIIDTGNTICCAAELLIKKGARSVIACATHGVFSGDCIQRLERSFIEAVYITDTIRQGELPEKFRVVKSEGVIGGCF